ncbi:type II secretion system minor pseudopilin GspK [Sphingomonas sp. LHG3406-1]|uniref:type II secretion system minor pseudopilin GspK n=1 Tax=Sphingomonas sp. LHG3406-1 TaxID=2804617 RepID=UPI002626E445|nr:type II secretion system minor pseudopilin GspK [Sphingomonas sp. LHG3406-1]
MIVHPSERGAALLTVLMLVAVIATISATALDRLTVATRLSANGAFAAQGRQWLGLAEQLAAARLEDLASADAARTLPGPWLGQRREIRLPDGGLVRAEVRDAGNCFNLNSLARPQADASSIADPLAVQQMLSLLTLLGVDSGRASGIAAAAADWVDSDRSPLPGGSEQRASGSGWPPANAPFADVGELGAVQGVTPEMMTIVAPFLCALPEQAPSALNPNTMLPEQAPLLAMLAPAQLGLAAARARILDRPASGYQSSVAFWQSASVAPQALPPGAGEQIRLKSRWFELSAEVSNGGQSLASTTLIDLREARARIVRRRYGEAG